MEDHQGLIAVFALLDRREDEVGRLLGAGIDGEVCVYRVLRWDVAEGCIENQSLAVRLLEELEDDVRVG